MKARNRWVGLLVGLLCAASTLAESKSIPVEDRNAFEKQFIECAMEKFRNGCLLPLFLDHASPKMKNPDITVAQIDAVLQAMAGKSGVYGVHIISKTMKTDLYDDRAYIIEMGDGRLMCFRLIFENTLDKWYVFSYQFSDDKEALRKILGIPIL
ncbi:MAG: hypothetical protein LBF61_00305 [Azoarcus sp.]|jgi:hypothetical protein|nr:hypothetical protein [Azoarcus sp.]